MNIPSHDLGFSFEHMALPVADNPNHYHPNILRGTAQNPHFHMHPHYEILLVCSGDISVFTEDSHITHCGSCLLLYNKFQTHAQVNNVRVAYEKYFLTLPAIDGLALRQEFTRFCQYITTPAVLIPLTDSMLEYLVQPFKRLLELFKTTECSDPKQDSRIITLIGYLLSEMIYLLENQQHSPLEVYDPYIIHALEYINENLTKKITLQSIADNVHVGKTKLNSDFRKHMHISISQYIIEKRIQMARKYLLDDISVEETANRCGFYDISHFIHTFQKYFSITPAQYKKNMNKQSD